MREENKAKMLDLFHICNAEINEFREKDIGLYGIPSAQISWFLSAQLASGKKHRTFNTFAVTDVIQKLEGRDKRQAVTKQPEEFKHYPLKGLWKAHFLDSRFIYRNILNHWGLSYETSPKFLNLFKEVWEQEDLEPSPHGWQGKLAHAFVFHAFEDRAKSRKFTGEWLVFAKNEGKNYYLCIARHSSGREDDLALHAAILSLCAGEFVFLRKRLHFTTCTKPLNDV